MIVQDGIWSQIAVGTYIQASDLQVWRVDAKREGWLLCRNARGEEKRIPPQPLDTPVKFMVPTEAEAERLASVVLGARRIE